MVRRLHTIQQCHCNLIGAKKKQMLMKIVTILSLSLTLYTLNASADSQNVQEQINHDFVSRTMMITAAFDGYGVDSMSGYCGGVIFDSTTVLTSLHCVALETTETKPRPPPVSGQFAVLMRCKKLVQR